MKTATCSVADNLTIADISDKKALESFCTECELGYYRIWKCSMYYATVLRT